MNAPETAGSAALSERLWPGLVVCALDPGGTTGYTVGVAFEDELHIYVNEERFSMSGLHGFLGKLVAACTNLHIIYEDFEYRAFSRAGLDLTPVKLIGIIELFKDNFEPFTQFYKQSAATGKAFWSDDRLKEIDAYTVGKQHGRDSTRHLLQWAKFGAGAQWLDLDKMIVCKVENMLIGDWFGQ